MTNEIEAYKAKLALAYRAGYSGDAAVNYADLIVGDTVESATAYAEKLHSVTTALANANRQSVGNDPADDNDDPDAADSVARSDFASVMGEYL